MASTNKISILLLNPPFRETIIRDNYCCFTSKSGYVWPPIDLLYLSGIFNHSKIKVAVIDAVVEHLSWKQVEERVSKERPKIIISLTGTVSFREDMEELNQIKKISSSKIYILGNTPVFKPEFFLESYPFVDGIIHNFFDNKILEFILDKYSQCNTISFRKNGHLKIGKINYLKPLSRIVNVNPPQYNLFPLKKYTTPIAVKKLFITALTSSGCPFNCQFCVGSALNYHQRDIKELEREFDEMRKNGIKEIFFEDSTFNAYLPFTRDICNLLIKKNYQFSWSANLHSFNVTLDLLNLLKQAGCHTVNIGVESGCEEILKEYAPSKKKDKIRTAFNLCKQVGIKTLGYFIIGFPNETRQKALETIKFSQQLNPDFASFSVLTPDYGTKLYEEAVNKNLIEKKTLSFDPSNEAVLNNPYLTKTEQDELIRIAYRQFYFRPQKLIHYLKDISRVSLYINNGLKLIKKFFFDA